MPWIWRFQAATTYLAFMCGSLRWCAFGAVYDWQLLLVESRFSSRLGSGLVGVLTSKCRGALPNTKAGDEQKNNNTGTDEVRRKNCLLSWEGGLHQKHEHSHKKKEQLGDKCNTWHGLYSLCMKPISRVESQIEGALTHSPSAPDNLVNASKTSR